MISKKMFVSALGLTLGLTFVVLANLASSSHPTASVHAQQPATDGGSGPAIPAPTEWVPFSAHVKNVDTGSQEEFVRYYGKYHRRSDGSTRLETVSGNGLVKTVDIKNIAHNRNYVRIDGRWRSNPMALPDGGLKPLQRRVDMKGLEPHGEPVSGFLVYKFTDRGGVVSYKAPDLNFFGLRMVANKTVQDFYDVQIGEQSDDLFEPPAGVTVEVGTELSGIISRKKAQALKQLKQ